MHLAKVVVLAGALGCSYPDASFADRSGDVGGDVEPDRGTDETFDVGDASDATSDITPDISDISTETSLDTTPVDTCVPNGCGGCTPLEGAPGTPCSICKSTSWVCASTTTVTCATKDDRKAGVDLSWGGTSTSGYNLSRAFDVRVEWTTAHVGEIVDAKLVFYKNPYACEPTTTLPHPDPACSSCVWTGSNYACAVPSPTEGTLTVRFYKGLATEPGSVEIGSVALSTSSFAVGGPYPVTFTPSTTGGVVPAGTQMSILFTNDSTRWMFVMVGAPAGVGAPKSWSRTAPTPKGAWWDGSSSYSAFTTIDMNGCF